MEGLSSGLSVAGLIGAFANCVKLYGDILSIRDRDEDVHAAHVLLQIELYTFRKLQNVFVQTDPSSTASQPSLCNSILQWVQKDLERILDLCSRHASVDNSNILAFETATARPDNQGTPRNDGRVALGSKTERKVGAVTRRALHSVTWIASDKQRLKDSLSRLHQ